MSEPMISLAALSDLMTQIYREPYGQRWGLLQAVLGWADRQGYLAPRPEFAAPKNVVPQIAVPQIAIPEITQAEIDRKLAFMQADFGSDPVARAQMQRALMRHAMMQRAKSRETPIPPGPQIEAAGQAARDLNATAAASEPHQGPEGAEAASSPAKDAPVAPVAGGATSKPAGKKPLPPLWTEDEDARAIEMSVAGMSTKVIANTLGRPVEGTKFRLNVKLRDRISAAKRAAAAPLQVDPAPAPADAPVARPEPRPEPRPPAPATLKPSVHAFDASRPLWWRQIEAVLDSIGHKAPWTPALDLELIEELARGRKLAEIAADMRIDPAKVKDRFFTLNPAGRPSLVDQERLLQVLRARAAPAAQAAE